MPPKRITSSSCPTANRFSPATFRLPLGKTSNTVTVLEVLPNGNLNVAGEKRLAVGHEEEVIRFGGIVSPSTLQGNSVLSSQVADARIEYRGVGITDQIQTPGMLTKLFSKFSPN